MVEATFTAFAGERLLVSGSRLEVALAVKAAFEQNGLESILVFDDRTGAQIDFDLRGSDAEIAARLGDDDDPAGEAMRGGRPVGRPRLGVVAREITLLPRHWEWLSEQPAGASATIRKLVDAARANDGSSAARQARQSADRFMSAVLGNRPGYEEAARALYAGDRDRFLEQTENWPEALRDHARRLAEPALRAAPGPAGPAA